MTDFIVPPRLAHLPPEDLARLEKIAATVDEAGRGMPRMPRKDDEPAFAFRPKKASMGGE
jgi:hypothetical protein